MHYAAAAKSTKNGQSTNRDTKNYLTMTKYIAYFRSRTTLALLGRTVGHHK